MDQIDASNQFVGSTVLCLQVLFLRFLNSIISRKFSRINGPDGRFKPAFWVVCHAQVLEAVCRETPRWAIRGDFGSTVLCLQVLFLGFSTRSCQGSPRGSMAQIRASNQFVGSYAAQVLKAVCHETARWAISGDFGSIVLCLQ
jgi:hypothetical protein